MLTHGVYTRQELSQDGTLEERESNKVVWSQLRNRQHKSCLPEGQAIRPPAKLTLGHCVEAGQEGGAGVGEVEVG